MATLANLLVKIGVDGDDVERGADKIGGIFDSTGAKVAAFGVAGGAAMEGFARSQLPLTEQSRKLAQSLGTTEGAVRDLALETTNVTFPLNEVLGLMESGRQQGLKTGDELQRFAKFWDMVGDATGESGVELGNAGVALRALGIDAGNEGEALAAFGFISQETTQDVGDFLGFVERTGPQLRDLGLDVDDTAAIFGILEGELGLTARTARTEFRKAVNESDGDLNTMLQTLGISEQQFGTYRGAVDASSDVIERNAAIHAESFTPMERLAQKAEELMFKFGGLADVAGALAIPLIALGPIYKTVSLAKSGVVKIIPSLVTGFKAVGTGFLALSKILLANPWVLVAAAIIALVIVVIKNWDTIKEVIGKAWEVIKKVTAVVWDAIKKAVSTAVDFLVKIFMNFTVPGLIIKHWDTIKSATSAAWDFVKNAIKKVVDFVVNLFMNFTAPGLIIKHWDTIKRATSTAWNGIVSFIRGIPGKIVSIIRGLVSSVASTMRSVWSGGLSAVRSGIFNILSAVRQIPSKIRGAIPNPWNLLKSIGKSIIQGLINGITSMLGSLGSAVGRIGGFIKDLKGPEREDRKLLIPEGAAIIESLMTGLGDGLPELRHMLTDITDEITTGVDAEMSAGIATPPPAEPQRVVFDVTGSDEDMKRLVRKLIRASGLELAESF